MSDPESEDEVHDTDMSSPNATANGDVVQYGELNVPGQDSVAVGVAAGNIHLQSADAATLALPEASQCASACASHSTTNGFRTRGSPSFSCRCGAV